ncbi:MAG: cell wall hydrolase [Nanoarchaeota archaeon]
MTLLIALLCASLARAESQEQIIAEVIAAEAAGEGERGLRAVACVIANRARAQHKTPYQIVTAKNQFYGLTAKNRIKLYHQVKLIADRLARDIMKLKDITDGALYFRNHKTEPVFKWCKILTFKHNNHWFYR